MSATDGMQGTDELKQGQQLAVPSEAEGITMALKEGRAQRATPLLALTRGGGGATAKYCG